MDQTIMDLLDDAKRVACHGVRAGSFGKDEPLFGAIRDAEAQELEPGGLVWSSPQTTELQKALNGAIRAVHPVTLYDIKSGWRLDIDSPAEKRTPKVMKALVLAFTVALLVVTAIMTNWQQHAMAVTAELASDKHLKQQASLNELLSLISGLDQGDLNSIRDPGSPLSASLRHNMLEVRSLYASIASDQKNYQDSLGTYFPDIVAAKTRETWNKIKQLALPMLPSDTGSQTSGAAIASEPAMSGTSDRAPDNTQKAEIRCQPKIDDLAKVEEALAMKGQKVFYYYSSWAKHEQDYLDSIECILGIDQPRTTVFVYATDAWSLQERIESLGKWWLPAIYGMLGALVYHLRIYLNNTRPDPSFLKVALRVALGGFAGIAIGWVWLPTSGQVLGVPMISITPLTIAFLLGFAIDVFLSFLERLVTLMNRWINGLGAPA